MGSLFALVDEEEVAGMIVVACTYDIGGEAEDDVAEDDGVAMCIGCCAQYLVGSLSLCADDELAVKG